MNQKYFLKDNAYGSHMQKKTYYISNTEFFFLANKLKADGIFMNNKKIMCNMINAKSSRNDSLLQQKFIILKKPLKLKIKQIWFLFQILLKQRVIQRKEMKIFYFISPFLFKGNS